MDGCKNNRLVALVPSIFFSSSRSLATRTPPTLLSSGISTIPKTGSRGSVSKRIFQNPGSDVIRVLVVALTQHASGGSGSSLAGHIRVCGVFNLKLVRRSPTQES